jgi:hypothetical protein
MLPAGGYRRGTLIEWITPGSHSGGYGADFISLITAQQACQAGGALVVFDPDRQFYPPAANALGIHNSNLIVLRPSTRLSKHADDDDQNEICWAIDQALRCSAVAAVWGSLDYLGERWFRRFQLAAESSGTLGLFVRPASALNRPSWAEVQWQVVAPEAGGQVVARPEAGPEQRPLRLRLHRCRGTLAGNTIDLEINTITGSVCEATCARSDHEKQFGDPHPPFPRQDQFRSRHSQLGSRHSQLGSRHSQLGSRHSRSGQLAAKTGSLSVAAQLAHPKTRRRPKRA